MTIAAIGLAVALLLSSCEFYQGRGFAVGTESTRLNVVVFVDATRFADTVQDDRGTAAARKLVLDFTPTTISLSAAQRALACSLEGGLCIASHLVPKILLSWFRSDVRDRSDFGGDLGAARRQQDCFAWTAVPGRNFTTKSPGTSGCK